MKIKRNYLIIQKQLNSIFHFFISERGAWKEEYKNLKTNKFICLIYEIYLLELNLRLI
jgi:hypothetical protein